MQKTTKGGAIKVSKDCPVHGFTQKAKDRFWDNPYTCHWACHCVGVKRYEPLVIASVRIKDSK